MASGDEKKASQLGREEFHEARQNRRVLLGLGLLDSEGVVGQRVEADCGGLVGVE